SLCAFLVLASRCLGPIMVQTSLESGLPRWAPPWPSQVIAPCGGPGWPPRHFPLTLLPWDHTTSSRVIARRAREAAGSGYGSSTPDPARTAEGPDDRIGHHVTVYPQMRRRVPGHVTGLRFSSKGYGFDPGSGRSRRLAGVRLPNPGPGPQDRGSASEPRPPKGPEWRDST